MLLNSVKTYAELNPEQQKEYDRQLKLPRNKKHKEQVMTWLDKKEAAAEKRGIKRGIEVGEQRGEKRGIERGEKRGLLDSIQQVWTVRFGAMPEDLTKSLAAPESAVLP